MEALCCIFILSAEQHRQLNKAALQLQTKSCFWSQKETDAVELATFAPLQFNLRNSYTRVALLFGSLRCQDALIFVTKHMVI